MPGHSSFSLCQPVATLPNIGKKIAEKLGRLGIITIRDALFHLPYRYLDKTRITPICFLHNKQYAVVQGKVEFAQLRFSRQRSLICRINDGSGIIDLRFFYFSKMQQQRLSQKGIVLRCYGQVRSTGKSLEMSHPEYRCITPDNLLPVEERLTAVYPSTDGLRQKTLQKIMKKILKILKNNQKQLLELLPEEIRKRFNLIDLQTALYYIHEPPADANLELLADGRHSSQQRLAFEELLAHHLSLQRSRERIRHNRARKLKNQGKLCQHFLKQLPFELTTAQQKVVQEISKDIQKDIPMLRLLQGEVGSGKTVVAAMAALQALESGVQVAIMVPTELLAEQHYHTFKQWCSKLDIEILLLKGKTSKSKRQLNAERLNTSMAIIAIGTHALFQKNIQFCNLGLVIIDEQHRFGVHQRLSLLDKGINNGFHPHQLIMTATPIPRTLAMTAYADLDLSIIDSLPPNRKIVRTSILSNERRDDIIQKIKNICDTGRQVYWVCTLIEESDVLQCQTATDTYQQLIERLPTVQIGLIHGRMKNVEKEKIILNFRNNQIKLLVATTVIEVGVDVPNASLMIIENAERLGSFQLHQLRGRVGRGSAQSDCILMYQSPLGDLARSRFEIIRNTNDGFKIAEQDLQLRGPGEITGTRQTGLPSFRIANIVRDAHLLPNIKITSRILMEKYSNHVQPILTRWLGQNVEYEKV